MAREFESLTFRKINELYNPALLGTQKRQGASALNKYIAGREATDEGPHANEKVV